MALLPYKPDLKTELDAMPITELFVNYFNWRLRYVAQETRNVHKSREFLANSLSSDLIYQSALATIISDIESGNDLTRYLSRRIKYGYMKRIPGAYTRQRDMDMMLNDWSIHHLHMNVTLENDGFVIRTSDVLFVGFGPHDAYLINIFPHCPPNWASSEVADILIENFPESRFVHEINGITGLGPQPTDDERIAMRNNGIATPGYVRNGKAYFIGVAPISTAGTSIGATLLVGRLIDLLQKFVNNMTDDPSYYKKILQESGHTVPQIENFHFLFFPNDHFGIVEENSKTVLHLH